MQPRFYVGFLLVFLALQPVFCSVPTIHETWQKEWDAIEKGVACCEIDAQDKEGDFTKTIVASLKKQSGFIVGAATAEYQILGREHLPNSQMAQGEHDGLLPASGRACGDWDQHFRDIALIEDCGLNGYRFSIDWSAIEPKEGQFDLSKINHYVRFCKELRARNIKVVPTLHHFVHPQWFEELGGFEKSENNRYLVRFCKKAFLALAPYVDHWCTINEPGIYVFQSYIRGVFPPFKSVTLPYLPSVGFRGDNAPREKANYGNVKLAGQVLLNLLNAHVEIYQTLHETWQKQKTSVARKQDLGLEMSEHEEAWLTMEQSPSIGFVHQYLTFRNFNKTRQVMPYQSLCAAALLTGSAVMAWRNHAQPRGLNDLPLYGTAVGGALLVRGIIGRIEETVALLLNGWINESVMGVFERGEFNFPGAGHLKQIIPGATQSFDFAGLNYYSVVSFNLFNGGPDYYRDDIRTDMPYGIYAEGLYRAIERMNKLGKPIYITENGIADKNNTNDTVRSTWIKRHFWAVKKAIDEGCNVRGFFYWSLLDNWEWDMGYKEKFGLYAVNFNQGDILPRTLRDGSRLYQKIAVGLLKP